MDKMCKQAQAEYPAECCGILSQSADGELAVVHECENIQERKHQEDPQRYPRNARTAYLIDPQQKLRISAEAEASGGRVVGFYHSHIDCAAYFSEEDERRTWIFNSREAGEEPDEPGMAYLVLSVYGEEAEGEETPVKERGAKREVKNYKCFSWDGGGYGEMDLEIVD